MKTFLLFVICLVCVLCASPAHAAIAYDSNGSCASANTTNCTPTATTSGNVGVVFATRSGSTTAPTCPAGWTCPATWTASGGAGSSALSWRMGCKKFTTTNDTSGTWTNAGNVVLLSYSGSNVGNTATCDLTFGAVLATTAASATLTFGTITTMTHGDATSWVIGFAGSRTATNVNQAPTGMSNRKASSTTDMVTGNDTNGTVSSWSSKTITVSTATQEVGIVLELLVSQQINIVGSCVGTAETASPGASVTVSMTPVGGAGHFLVAIGRSGGTPSSITISDNSGVNVWSNSAAFVSDANIGGSQGAYTINPVPGTYTISSTPNASQNFQSVMACEFAGPATGVAFDVGASGSTATSTNPLVTSSFTTSASGIVILAATINNTAGTWSTGAIGSNSPTLVSSSSNDSRMEHTSFGSGQSSITARMSNTSSTLAWDWFILTFKVATPVWTLTNSQFVSTFAANPVSTPAFTNALTNPSLLTLGVVYGNGASVSSITDTAGNTFVDSGVGAFAVSAGGQNIQFYYAWNTHTTASDIVTVTYSAGNNFNNVHFAEFTGGTNSSPIDVVSGTGPVVSSGNGANTFTLGSNTTTKNNDLIVVIGGDQSNPMTTGNNPHAFITLIASENQSNFSSEYLILTSAGTIAPTFGTGGTDSVAGIWASFLYLPASGCTTRRTLLGAGQC